MRVERWVDQLFYSCYLYVYTDKVRSSLSRVAVPLTMHYSVLPSALPYSNSLFRGRTPTFAIEGPHEYYFLMAMHL